MSADALRDHDVAVVKAALAALKPPFSAEIERELIAIAYGHEDAGLRKAALALVDKHVKAATQLKTVFKKSIHSVPWHDACAKLRALDIPDRGKLATAFVARGINVHGVALEEDAEFAKTYIYKLLRPAKRELYLTEAPPPKGARSYMPEYVDLTRFPEVVFDELAGLRKKCAFDSIDMNGGSLTTLPDRFALLAPFLKRLCLSYNKFVQLPDVLFACTNLEELTLTQFELVDIGEAITKLKKLKKLFVSDCKKLKTLPPAICDLPALEFLGLPGSPMRSLPPEIGKLKSLRELYVQTSKISSLPDELATLPKLAKVYITWSALDPAKVKALLPKRVKIYT